MVLSLRSLCTVGLALLAVSCGAPQERAFEGRTHHPRGPRLAAYSQPHPEPSPAPQERENDSTAGDLKTYAYASTDGAAIAAEVTSVLAPAAGGTVHYEGYELLDDAAQLEAMADDAKRRLKAVSPSDHALISARKEGISAYSLTAEFADLMVNLATADANDDLSALNKAANQALALEGSGEELAAYYTALITQLEAWSRSHPQSAAQALKQYGG
jgi:hypothetical protein